MNGQDAWGLWFCLLFVLGSALLVAFTLLLGLIHLGASWLASHWPLARWWRSSRYPQEEGKDEKPGFWVGYKH